ncbi:MAG: alpha/beta hydrolase [Woeseiaceae bacterium]|nr:alpha/beta hydrolase [Woeseiaceae bacterium]
MPSIWVYLGVGVLLALVILRVAFPNQLAVVTIRLIRVACGMKARTIDVDGTSWPYLEGGNPSGEPMLLIHGFGADKDNWSLLARVLRRDFRLIAPDLPGFGDNDKTPGKDYRPRDQARYLAAFVDAMGLDRFHLAGNSMGGYIALEFALAFPGRLKSMALLNNAGVSMPNKSDVFLAADRGDNVLVVNSVEEFAALLEKIAYKSLPFPRYVLNYLGDKAVTQRDFIDPIFWLMHDDIVNRPLDDRLHEIEVPTLIVWGSHDQILDVSSVDSMKDRLPNNEVVVFDDVGHVPMIECPKETAAAYRDFISRSFSSSFS